MKTTHSLQHHKQAAFSFRFFCNFAKTNQETACKDPCDRSIFVENGFFFREYTLANVFLSIFKCVSR